MVGEPEMTVKITNPYKLTLSYATKKIKTFTGLVETLVRRFGDNFLSANLGRRGDLEVVITVHNQMLVQNENGWCEHLKDSRYFVNWGIYISEGKLFTHYVLSSEYNPEKHN